MWVRRWKGVWAVLGLSIMLSGCLEIEATTMVLEDGRVIDTMVVQPKNSMLALLALSARGGNAADRGSDTAAGRAVSGIGQPKLLQELRTLGKGIIRRAPARTTRHRASTSNDSLALTR